MTIEPTPDGAAHAPDLDATHARQGRRGRHAFVILIVSLPLVVIAYVVIYAGHAGGLMGPRGGQEAANSSAARAFNGPDRAPKVTETGPQAGHSPPPDASQPSATTPS